MAVWTDFATLVASLASGKAFTDEKAQALAENVVALQEGDPSAPKVQPNAMRRTTFISGAAAQTQAFNGLADYSGIEFEVFGRTTVTTAFINFAYSTDGGASYSANQSIGGIPPTEGNAVYRGVFDFASGKLKVIRLGFDPTETASDTPNVTDVTMAGASLAINAVRFQGNAGSITSVVLLTANGGTE